MYLDESSGHFGVSAVPIPQSFESPEEATSNNSFVPERNAHTVVGTTASSYPGEATECADEISGVLGSIARLSHITTNLTDSELTDAARSLALVMQRAEAALIAVTADALDRGAVWRSTAADAAQWVGRLSRGESAASIIGADGLKTAGPLIQDDRPEASAGEAGSSDVQAAGLEPSQCSRISKIAAACNSSRHSVLKTALLSGAVNSIIAKTALDNVDPLVAALRTSDPSATRDQVYGYFLAALEPGAGAKSVRELSKRVIAQFAPTPDRLDKDEDSQRAYETLRWEDLPNGLVRLIADLSADHAEALKHAINSMAAPAPGSTCCDSPFHRHEKNSTPTGQADVRSPGKRRADALVELIRIASKYVDGDGQLVTHGSARLIVTMDYETLARKLRGSGRSEAGAVVSPETVRQLACDAEIIPMVLGSRSEPLDVGRKIRLVDKGLRAAVIERDRHCTFDGCSRPPPMCEVHHVKHWADGGETSLLNSALLCATHHRIVHRDRLTAVVSPSGVTWQHHHDVEALAASM